MATDALPATQERKTLTLKQWLNTDTFKAEIAKALPKHMTPDRFLRIALTAMTKTPKLVECEQSSFLSNLLTLSQLGLEPDGRRAHLIPFENRKRGVVECQLIIDYKGLAELVFRSGVVSTLHADSVCETDLFEVNKGQIVKHVVDYKKPRGAAYAYYAMCKFKDGAEQCEVMTRSEVDAIRKRSRAGNNGPWVTDYDEMAKKTVFRRLSKWLPLSPEIMQAIEADDKQFEPETIRDIPSVQGETRADQLAEMISQGQQTHEESQGEASDESETLSGATGEESQEAAESDAAEPSESEILSGFLDRIGKARSPRDIAKIVEECRAILPERVNELTTACDDRKIQLQEGK